MQGLLNKQKSQFLEYLLLHRDGDVFRKLMKHMKHHSLGTLLIELLQLKVTNKYYSPEKVQMFWQRIQENHGL